MAAPAPAPVPPPTRPSLAEEQRRLAALFRGTPVVFAMQSESRLQVDVPLRNSFDAGKSAIKAPLAAVLDRIAGSQADGGSRISVSAPADRMASPPARAASGAKAGTAGASAASPSAAASAAGKADNSAAARQERLANDRRRSVTDYLARKGIDPSRVVPTSTMPAGTSVRLLIDDRPTP